jgi:hypothetical protein
MNLSLFSSGSNSSGFVNYGKDLLYQLLSMCNGKHRFTFGYGAC